MEQVAVGKKIRVKAAGVSGAGFEGEVAAIDSRFDNATRNFLVRGTVRNPEGKLRAGMFVNVEVLLPEEDVVSIPASSINYAPYGDSVFIVKDEQGAKTAQQQIVKLGESRGDQVAVVSGVKPGDEVVSSGVFK